MSEAKFDGTKVKVGDEVAEPYAPYHMVLSYRFLHVAKVSPTGIVQLKEHPGVKYRANGTRQGASRYSGSLVFVTDEIRAFQKAYEERAPVLRFMTDLSRQDVEKFTTEQLTAAATALGWKP